MPKQKKPSNSSKNTSSSLFPRFTRESFEQMYYVHLFLLIVMTILASVLSVTVYKQVNQISSLKFQLRFIKQRYDVQKDRTATPSDVTSVEEVYLEKVPNY